MAHIIHACSSVLVRPNGIVRYINSVVDLQRSQTHTVSFLCDSFPTQRINANEIHWLREKSRYTPNTRDGHVWLQVDMELVEDLVRVFQTHANDADLVVCHDLHSFLAAQRLYSDGVFVQHESDVLTPHSRWSFLSDEYLDTQLTQLHSTNWRIGLTVPSSNIRPAHPIPTPVPFDAQVDSGSFRARGLLYVGDSTERKGAKEFMCLARALGVTPTVITHEVDDELFSDADVYKFSLDQKQEMYSLMREHRVAFIASKNECPGIAALECLQFMPTVVDSQYSWTQYLIPMGAKLATGVALENTVRELLNQDWVAGSDQLAEWSKQAKQCWVNLTN
jgi:hypothetical protein